jgi:glycosyltransferase involved in cell wall biosynthesis
LARELELGDAVRWLGWTDDVRDVLAEATAFTLSSRSEGTSISLLEAMSLEVCPVVTAVGGNPAVLGGELAHRLVPSGDVAGLANAYRSVLANDGERRRDAVQARRRVEAEFSLAAMVRAYAKIYVGGAGAAQ